MGSEMCIRDRFLRYTRSKPFAWFPEEEADARRQADKDPNKRIVGDTAKLKANSFYGKMIEDVTRHADTISTSNERRSTKRCDLRIWKILRRLGVLMKSGRETVCER